MRAPVLWVVAIFVTFFSDSPVFSQDRPVLHPSMVTGSNMTARFVLSLTQGRNAGADPDSPAGTPPAGGPSGNTGNNGAGGNASSGGDSNGNSSMCECRGGEVLEETQVCDNETRSCDIIHTCVPATKPVPAKPPPLNPPSPQNANMNTKCPVQLSNGTFRYSFMDLASASPAGQDFAFTRFYNQNPDTVTANTTATYYGPLGWSWGHSYHWKLTEDGGSGNVRVLNQALNALDFTLSAGTFNTTVNSIDWSLVKNGDNTFDLTHLPSHYNVHFDTDKLPVAIKDRFNNTETLAWATPNVTLTEPTVLTTITAISGLTYTLTYDSPNPSAPLADQKWYITTLRENVTNRVITYDTTGDLVNFQQDSANVSPTTERVTYGYTSAGGDPFKRLVLTSVTNRKGQLVWSNQIDGNYRVTSQKENTSGEFTYAFSAPTSTITRTAPSGGAEVIILNADGKVVSMTDADGDKAEYDYDSRQNLTEYNAPGGAVTTLSYSTSNRVTRSEAPDGGVMTFSYNVTSDLTSMVDTHGHTTTLVRDATGNITATIDPLGYIERWTFNSRGQKLTYVNKRGFTWSYTYNPTTTFLESVTDPLGNVKGFEYDSRYRQTASIDPDGGRTTFDFDAASRIIKQTNALGGETQWTYDAESNVQTITNPRGVSSTYQYTMSRPYDKPSVILKPAASYNFTYDAEGRLSQSTEPPELRYAYDSAGRIARTTDVLNATDYYTYTDNSQIATYQDRAGRVTTYGYDICGRNVTTTYADGATEIKEYDTEGLLTAVIAPGGGRTEFEYDALHRLIRTTDPLGRDVVRHFDASGNVTATVLPGDRTWLYTYDALDRKVQAVDPNGGSTRYVYDCTCGRVTALGNSRNATTTFTYDLLKRKTSQTDPLGNQWAWTYDANGNVLTEKDPTSNSTITYTFDNGDRVVAIAYPDSNNVTVTYAGEKWPATAEDGSTLLTYGWDAAWRKTSLNAKVKGVLGAQGTTMYYGYNPTGNTTRVATESALESNGINYTRDSRDRISLVSELYNFQTYNTTVTYNLDSQPVTITRPNGVTTSVTYTAAREQGSITHSITSTIIERFSMGRDPTGNVTSRSSLAGTITYGYDILGRLTSASGPVETEAWTYDSVGNMLTWQSTVSGNVTHTYNQADQLTSSTDNTTYTYNTRGDLTQTVNPTITWTYAYDGARRLKTTALNGTVNVTYTYYPRRPFRRSRDETGQPKVYFILDDRNVFEDHEETSPGMTMAKVRYPSFAGTDMLLARRYLTMGMGDTVGYYLGDQLGSTAYLVNESGNVSNTYTYSAYGVTRSVTETVTQRYRYTQREWDGTTGLQYNRNRYYIPSLGRFTQPDPLGAPEGSGRYEYASGNPISMKDPSGLQSQDGIWRPAPFPLPPIASCEELADDWRAGCNMGCDRRFSEESIAIKCFERMMDCRQSWDDCWSAFNRGKQNCRVECQIGRGKVLRDCQKHRRKNPGEIIIGPMDPDLD